MGVSREESDEEFFKRVSYWTGPGEADAVSPADIRRLLDMVIDLQKQRNGAYNERNRVVAALAKVAQAVSTPDNAFGAGVKQDPEEEEGWQTVCYIDLPLDMGQVSFHFPDDEVWLLRHIGHYKGEWDGHTTEEKFARLDGAL